MQRRLTGATLIILQGSSPHSRVRRAVELRRGKKVVLLGVVQSSIAAVVSCGHTHSRHKAREVICPIAISCVVILTVGCRARGMRRLRHTRRARRRLWSSSTPTLADLSSLVRVCATLAWHCGRGACVAAMCGVPRAELSILSFFSTSTDRSLPSHASPDSAHCARFAEVDRENKTLVTGLQHFTSCVKAGA